jgi:hypothetical protein
MDDMSRTLSSSVVVIQDADMKPFKRPGDIVFRQWRTVIAMFLGPHQFDPVGSWS